MVPTQRALELAEPVKRVLAEVEAMLQPPNFEPSTANITLSIASTDYALRAVVVPFLSALRQRAPNIRIAVRPIDDERVPVQLERGEIDFALMTPETTPADLHARRFYDHRANLVPQQIGRAISQSFLRIVAQKLC